MVAGTREHTEALRTEIGDVLTPLGLRLADAKTRVVHLDEGFGFLGFHIQRKRRKGSNIKCVYTYPSKKALAAVMAKVRAITHRTSQPNLTVLLQRLNSVLRGWCAYFRHGVSKKTFSYLGWWAYSRVLRWIFARHNNAKWASLRRRYVIDGRITSENGVVFFDPHTVAVTRYQRRAKVPTPWSAVQDTAA
jgi:RNA-directed DNA polymerase